MTPSYNDAVIWDVMLIINEVLEDFYGPFCDLSPFSE